VRTSHYSIFTAMNPSPKHFHGAQLGRFEVNRIPQRCSCHLQSNHCLCVMATPISAPSRRLERFWHDRYIHERDSLEQHIDARLKPITNNSGQKRYTCCQNGSCTADPKTRQMLHCTTARKSQGNLAESIFGRDTPRDMSSETQVERQEIEALHLWHIT
jgi:hypothetical protein